MNSPEDVLGLWFAPGNEAKWFEKDEAFDQAIKGALLPLYERAAAGDLDAWLEDERGCLALCILLDQVPRNLFRGLARAFATDEKARAVTYHVIERGLGQSMTQYERCFLLMPLEHSEDLADQELCCRLMAELGDEPDWLTYAERHREIIARFGRFPHRNEALGRETTAEEAAFLKEPNSSF